ncbi:MAG: phosphohydrolase [Burkholderiales bacterium PBB2]|nr:MAG: phosphohydrolase [Burkholderiales bacterium PBB2]
MELIQLPPHSLRVGQVLSFALRDAEGHLLFAAGQPLPNTPQVQALIARGAWVQAHETKEYQRALAHKMDTLMHQGAVLADIVKVQADFRQEKAQKVELGEQAAWADLQMHAHSLLREPRVEDFKPRFQQLHNEALRRLLAKPDAVLMLLIFETSQNFQSYSDRHALLCLALAELCARQLGWPDDWRLALTQAALSMNLSITNQQDRLAAQTGQPSPAQQQELVSHGDRSAALLTSLGVRSELWLQTVCLHHDAGPGALAGRAPAEQLARLLRRIDIFGARLSPRRSRAAMAGASAARAVYLDELKQPDEAGAALIKTTGLYPPGSLVRLANGEVGIVFKRGHSATEPLVAALLGKSGSPLSEPVPRDTRLATQAISASLAPQELKLRINIERLLKLAGAG